MGSMGSIREIIRKPLPKNTRLIKGAAEGDITKRLDDNVKNEIGELSTWFNKFISNQMHVIDSIGVSDGSSRRTVKQVAHVSKRFGSHAFNSKF